MSKLFRLKLMACTFAAIFTAVAGSSASAATVTLNIDPTQSSLNIGGAAFGLAYGAQGPGSLSTSLGGTLTADLSGGVFTFSGGSNVVVNTNPNGPFTSSPNPSGVIPGNFGVVGAGVLPPPFGSTTVNGVYRDLTLDVTAGTAQDGQAMAGGILKFIGAGQLVWGAATQAGNQVGISNITAQGNNTAGSSVLWDGTTLTLPILFSTTGSNRGENWNGVIVATVVPEPSALALLSLAGLLGLRRSRRPASIC